MSWYKGYNGMERTDVGEDNYRDFNGSGEVVFYNLCLSRVVVGRPLIEYCEESCQPGVVLVVMATTHILGRKFSAL